MHQFKIKGLPDGMNGLSLVSMQIGANAMYDKLQQIVPEVKNEKEAIEFIYDPITKQTMFSQSCFSEKMIALIDKAGEEGKFE